MSKETLLQIDTDQELAKIIQKMNTLHDQLAAPDIFRKALNAAGRKVRKQMVADAKEQYAIEDTKALNSTARKVRAQMVKDVKKQYAITDKRALKEESRGAPQVQTASVSTLAATVRSRGPMQDIMAFMTRPNTETGAAAAKVLKSGSMKALEMGNLKAFVTTFRSGHTAIVQRRGAQRLPVKKLLSPAVPHLLDNEEVRTQAEALAYDILQNEIQKRIQKINAARA